MYSKQDYNPQNKELFTQYKLNHVELTTGEAKPAGNRHNDGALATLLTHSTLTHSTDKDPPLSQEPPPLRTWSNKSATPLQVAEGKLLESRLATSDVAIFDVYQDWVH